jgi:hypothetical protein
MNNKFEEYLKCIQESDPQVGDENIKAQAERAKKDWMRQTEIKYVAKPCPHCNKPIISEPELHMDNYSSWVTIRCRCGATMHKSADTDSALGFPNPRAD